MPFFMYLKKRPTIFRKDGQIREVFHSVTADELTKAGWVIEGEEEPMEDEPEVTEEPDPDPEERAAIQSVEMEEELEAKLKVMVKAELISFAEQYGVSVDPHATKAVIIAKILEDIDVVEKTNAGI